MVILTQVQNFVFGQSQDWKQIGSPFKTTIHLKHQTSHGHLFGQLIFTNQWFFSDNNGQSWRAMPDELGIAFSEKLIIREDQNGDILIANGYGIHKFNPINMEYQHLLNIEAYDLTVLKNGNILVAHFYNLKLYSADWQLLNSYEWQANKTQFLMDDEDENHFVQISYGIYHVLLQFNEDLSVVQELSTVTQWGGISTSRSINRFFRKDSYSDDGINWTALNLPPRTNISYFDVGMDGRVFYISEFQLYISDDNGNSFVQRSLPAPYCNFISSNPNGVIVTSHDHVVPVIYTSDNSGNTWSLIPFHEGIPYMPGFAAGVEENLFAFYDEYSYYKENENAEWKLIVGPEGRLSHPKSLSNGSIIALSSYYQLYQTKDRGKSWESLSNQFISIPENTKMEEKFDALYQWSKDSLYFSTDYGRSWSAIQGIDQEIFGIQPNSYLHYYNFGLHILHHLHPVRSEIVNYNFLTKEQISIPYSGSVTQLATSYYNETLYGIKETNEPSLATSVDNGKTFTFKPIIEFIPFTGYNLKTDKLNNIYLYSHKQILYSEDQGDSWHNISPDFPELLKILDVEISPDNYIYLSTVGMGVLKYNMQLRQPNRLLVSVLDDQNKNCQVDPDEPVLKGMKVLVNNKYLQELDYTGKAIFLLHSDINEVKVIYNSDLYEDCEASYIVEFSDTDQEILLNIPLKVSVYCANPLVGISTPFLRRCFDNTYSGSVCNEGSIESINTDIVITLDTLFDFISASLPIKSLVDSTLILDAGNIPVSECKSFHFTININCRSALGMEHCISAITTTDANDCIQATIRNEYVECQENIGAYDPNDKNIFVNGNRNQSYIEPGDKIEYLIRFQNTGTDTAFSVRIEDPISSKFVISSIRPIASSHDYKWSINNSLLVVLFEDIQLVDSFKNEPASHGFIKFEIKLDSLTSRGDEVTNLAGIFFDFNEPIITEEVVTVIGQPLNTKEHSFESITAFPNPANGLVYISGNSLSDKPQDLMIYDIHGKLILSQKISFHDNRIDISKCAPGTYMLMMKSGEKVFRGKVLKM